MRTFIKLFLLLFTAFSFAQTTVKGKITDDSGLPLPGANVIIVGTTTGVISDFDGEYTLKTNLTPPFTIRVSSVGFETLEQQVTSNTSNQTLDFQLKEGNELDEIVISASRTPERVFESPVSIERFGIKEIKNTASADFYNGLENLKGVDLNTGSLTFKQVNTRGFADFNNARFVQLVDGADNSSPALNFVLGNLLGISELDVKSVELLPGASSALYGANAFNGILFLQSKSPFDEQGIKTYARTGLTSQDAAGDNDYYDFGFKAAYKFSDKFAVKVNFSYLRGTDWFAVSEEDQDTPGGTRETNTNFDGLNIYGDEVSTNIRDASGLGIIPDIEVSRTGYAEEDLTDYNAESIKADWTLAYRPFGNDFEISYVGRVGQGSTIFQATNRNQLNDFLLQQHKVEIKNNNFFVRGYVTAEDAGDSYDTRFTGININRAWKSDTQWFGDYINAFAGATLQGLSPEVAEVIGRTAADEGRLIPGTPEFQEVFDRVIADPDLQTGSRFQDETKLYHADVNYNFSHLTSNFADIQVGGSFREYNLNSNGTIFTDFDGPIIFNEIGIYTQIQKQLLDDRLKLTGSVRYDKNELFDGFASPRFSVGYTLGEKRNHNLRASVQTGFRNPTNQNLFIGLDVGAAILVGTAEGNAERFVRTANLSADGQAINNSETIEFNGSIANTNSYSASSAAAFAATGNPALLQIANPDEVEPEQVTSFEVGYRSQLFDKKVTVDVSGYYSSYDDFIATENVVAPLYGSVFDASGIQALANGDSQVFQVTTNSDVDIESYGVTASINARVFGGFDAGINYTLSDFEFDEAADPDFRPGFNTAQHKVKASFGHTDLFKNFGFNVAWRWSDNYFWQAPFADGNVPAYQTIDAQINYRLPSLKSTIKAGATNLLGDEYFTAFGTGLIGSQFFISWTINNL